MAGRVAVVGATGQIGRPLSSELIRSGHAVSVFSRDPARARRLVPGAADFVEWHPGATLPAECAGHLSAADAVVYLAGGPLFDGRRHGVRTVGYVLTQASLASQVAQFRRHFGGWIGTGRGWTPWIHVADEVGIITFALQRQEIDGPVNLTAPAPVRSRQFAQALGRVLGHRAWLPVPPPFARMGLGAVTDIIVRGKRVLPAKATAAGYQFRFPALEPALRDILQREPGE
jgi:NAD dependent epimerase/dehydratase family enzyme